MGRPRPAASSRAASVLAPVTTTAATGATGAAARPAVRAAGTDRPERPVARTAERGDDVPRPTRASLDRHREARPIDRPDRERQPDVPASRSLPADDEARRAVDAVLRGEREAFRVLVERESATVVRACYRILGDRDEAEDAAQEAFVTAFRALPAWRADGPFGAWLTRIAVRVALRAAAKRRSVGRLVALPIEGAESSVAASGAFDPASVALRSERAAEIRSAVARLDDPYREIVALRFFGELSLLEIATAVERPLPTVKTQLRRGLLRLRATLAEREPVGATDVRVRA